MIQRWSVGTWLDTRHLLTLLLLISLWSDPFLAADTEDHGFWSDIFGLFLKDFLLHWLIYFLQCFFIERSHSLVIRTWNKFPPRSSVNGLPYPSSKTYFLIFAVSNCFLQVWTGWCGGYFIKLVSLNTS